MSFTQFLFGEFLKALTQADPYSAPETWVALLDDTGTELANVDYARQQVHTPSSGLVPRWTQPFTSASGSRVENGQPISFGVATVDWGVVAGVAIFDAPTGPTNKLMQQLLPQARNVFAGDPFRIPQQALKIRLARPT